MAADILLTIGIDPSQLSRGIQQVQSSLSKTISSGKVNAGLGITQKKLQGTSKAIGAVDHKARRNIPTMVKWAVGWTLAYGAIRKVQEGLTGIITVTRDVETQMAMIRVVTDESAQAYKNLQGSIFNTAKEFGGSILDITSASRTWAQQGRSVAEVMELTRTTMIGANITGDSAKTIVSNLTAALKIYGLSVYESISVMDKWIAVASKHAIESGQLAQGLKRVGTIAREVGINLDELNGYLTAVHAVTRRELSAIGTAFRTVFARMARESTLSLIATLAKVPTYIDETGQATTRVTETYRDFSEILDDVAARWSGLSQAVRFHLAQQIAGVRRMEIFTALMQNYDEALLARIHSEASAGRAMRANAIIINTYQKEVEKLTAAFAELQVSLGEAGVLEFFKNLTYGIKGIVEALKGAPKIIIGVTTALLNLAAVIKIVRVAFGVAKFGLSGWMSVLFLAAEAISFFGSKAKKAKDEAMEFNDEIERLQSLREYQRSLRNLAEEYLNLYDNLKGTSKGQKVLSELLRHYNILATKDVKVSNDLGKAFKELSDIVPILGERFDKVGMDIRKVKMDEIEEDLNSLKEEYKSTLSSLSEELSIDFKPIDNIEDAEDLMGRLSENIEEVQDRLERFKEKKFRIFAETEDFDSIKLIDEIIESTEEKVAKLNALYKEIEKSNVNRAKTEEELNKLSEKGKKLEKDKNRELLEGEAIRKLGVQHELEIGKILGLSEITLARINIQLKEQNGLYEKDSDRLKDQLTLQRAILKETYKLAQTLQDDVANSLFSIIEGTGTWQNLLKNITDTIIKEQLADVLSNIEEETGIFKTISKAIKGKGALADAHTEALTSGAAIIKAEEISGHTIGGDILKSKLMEAYQGMGAKGGGGLGSISKDLGNISDSISKDLGDISLGGAFKETYGAGTGMDTFLSDFEKSNALTLKGAIGDAEKASDIRMGILPKNAPKGGGFLGGAGKGLGAAGALYGAYQGGSPIGGALSGAMAGAMFGPIGMGVGAIVGGLLGAFGSKKDTPETQEQTNQITSKIEITNKKLDITNRNLSAIRDKATPYALPESHYFSSDSSRGYMR